MNINLTTDEELLSTVAAGDEHGLAELYDRHGRSSVRLAYGVIGDRHLAEDAVQDAFLAVWRSAATFDPARATARTWLFTIVHRRSVDLVRGRARRPLELVENDRLLDLPTEAAEEDAIDEEQRRAVRQALATLGPTEREAVALAYWGGLSQSEIAVALGIPLGTVKSRTFSALTHLRTVISPEPAYV